MLAVDAETKHCLGLLDVQVWRRLKSKSKDYRKQPIEEKESYRWIKGPQRAKAVLTKAALVTIIDDREGDIYEKWARLPDRRTHLLTRACRDRTVVRGGTLFAIMAGVRRKHHLQPRTPAPAGQPPRRPRSVRH